MILIINTSSSSEIIVSLLLSKKKKMINCKIKAIKKQAEKLLPLIEKFLFKNNISWREIKKIYVQNEGSSFTALRIGVLTANALAYALKIPIEAINGDECFKFLGGQIVKPKYHNEPNIGQKKNLTC